jgi:hypothetical protein
MTTWAINRTNGCHTTKYLGTTSNTDITSTWMNCTYLTASRICRYATCCVSHGLLPWNFFKSTFSLQYGHMSFLPIKHQPTNACQSLHDHREYTILVSHKLTADAVCMEGMPTIEADRLRCDIGDTWLRCGKLNRRIIRDQHIRIKYIPWSTRLGILYGLIGEDIRC